MARKEEGKATDGHTESEVFKKLIFFGKLLQFLRIVGCFLV